MLFLRYRSRRWRNFVRHHFDRATLLRLGLLVALGLFATGRSPADIGTRPAALTEPGSGARAFRLALLLLVPGTFLLIRRVRALRTPAGESARLTALGVPPDGVVAWARWRHALALAPFVAVAALASAAGGPDAAAAGTRVLLVLAAGGAAGIAAWHLGAPRRGGSAAAPGLRLRPAHTVRWSPGFPGGAVSALVRRDLLHLLRSAPAPLVLAGLVTLLLPVLVLRVAPDTAFLTVAVVHATLVWLELNLLLTLYERDALHFAFFKVVAVSGRRLWQARVLLTATLLALPPLPALAAAWWRQPEALLGALVTLLVLVLLPCMAALLFANVGVALVPRVGLAGLFLNAALGLTGFLWFFVPIVVPPLLLVLLGLWARRAPSAFDRMEAA